MRCVRLVVGSCLTLVLLGGNGGAAVGSVADAAMKGNIALVRSLLLQKADVNQPQADGATALHWAVRLDDVRMVELLIRSGASPKAANRFGVTPLSLACVGGDPATIEMLLKAGADPNAVLSDLGETPLMVASRTGNPAAVKVLLGHGADVNTRESRGQTALMWAAAEGHPALAATLIEHGADVHARSNLILMAEPGLYERANISVSNAAVPGSPEDIAFKAIQSETRPDGRLRLLLAFEKQFPQSRLLPDIYQYMLQVHQQKNDQAGLRAVLEKVYPLERQMQRRATGGMTPIMFAARENNLEVARILAAAGADVNSSMATGTSALSMAIVNAHFELAAFLLSQGADPNLADKDGKAALYAAVEMRNFAQTDTPGPEIDKANALTLIKALLDGGADPNARLKSRPAFRGGANRNWLSEPGATPFYRAAVSGDIRVLRLLLSYGADPSLPANDNTTPLMVAAGVGFLFGSTYAWPERDALEALELCLELGNVNAVNAAGLTALHGAAFRGWNAAVQTLVNNGAKLDVKDKQGRTPLNWADGIYRGGGIAPVRQVHTVALLEQLMK